MFIKRLFPALPMAALEKEVEIPEEVKRWYWRRLLSLTMGTFVAWFIVAIVLPVSAPAFKGVVIGSLPPLHWYIPAFISIVLGIVIIFVYAYLATRLDEELRRRVGV